MKPARKPGRPTIAPHLRKVKVGVCLSPWVVDALAAHPRPKSQTVEAAIIQYLNLKKPE